MKRLQPLLINDLSLAYPSSSKYEKRKYTRYKMNKNVLSISADIVAEVEDISISGISFRYQARVADRVKYSYDIMLLNCKLGTSVEGISGKMIRNDEQIPSYTLPSRIMRCSLEFYDLDRKKRKQLSDFIKEGGEIDNQAKSQRTPLLFKLFSKRQ